MTHDEKLELVKFLIFLQGKLQSLAIELLLLGEDPTEVDKAEVKLGKQIRKLRINMLQTWQGEAAALMTDLRQLNKKAQRRLREFKNAQNRTEKLANILGLIDKGLGALSGILL